MSKRIITHHRESEAFKNIKKGLKKMEIRLYDEKRQKIKINDKIRIINRNNEKEVIFVKVIGLSRFPNFEKLFLILGDKIKDYEKEILKRVYSKEKEEKYGVSVIHFELTNKTFI